LGRRGAGVGGAASLGHIAAMSRIAIAAPVGILGFLLYIGVVVALADHVLGWHWALQVPYFVVAGIAWVFPAKWLMFWAAGQR